MGFVNGRPESLADLVTLAKERFGVQSGRGLAKAAAAQGLTISYTLLNQIENGTYNSEPGPETRRMLARLAGVSPDAVASIVGVPVRPPFQFPEDESASLTGDQRIALLAVFRAFVNANSRADAGEQASQGEIVADISNYRRQVSPEGKVTYEEAADETRPTTKHGADTPPGASEEPDA